MAVYGHARRSVFPASVKVYLVGDSLTSGHAQGDGGWRKFLYQAMIDAGYDPDFRGAYTNTSDTPPIAESVAGVSHSGFDGSSGHNWYGTDGTDGYWANNSSFSALFPTAADRPHIICIAVGTNDTDSAASATYFCRLMDKALQDSPFSHVLFATAPHVEGSPTVFDDQAAQVRIEVAARQAAGKNVHLVDAHAVSLVTGDWSDGLHLTTRGYQKVARQAWIPAMFKALER